MWREKADSDSFRLLSIQFQLHTQIAWPWANQRKFMCFNLLICKMGFCLGLL